MYYNDIGYYASLAYTEYREHVDDGMGHDLPQWEKLDKAGRYPWIMAASAVKTQVIGDIRASL